MKKCNKNPISAGIVLYNPDIKRLEENITTIYPQVDNLYLFNNGSHNIDSINELISSYPNIILLNSSENLGISRALNTILSISECDGYDWVVTLDQDSVAPTNIVSEYKKYIRLDKVGMLCCKIVDRNLRESINEASPVPKLQEVELCITSASAIKIDAWEKVGGFCEEMFIDSVDFDICMNLRKHSYKIIKINYLQLLHEVGHSRKVRFLGKDELIFNHGPLRCYYMIRNRILLGKRHHLLLKQIGLAVKRLLLINLYETDKYQKNIMMLKGFYHAAIGKYGKYIG